MGYIDIADVSFVLPDGRPLLDEVTFRVADGKTTALIGPNGAGKTTLLRLIRGELAPHSGVVTIDGGLGVMDQFVGHGTAEQSIHDLLVSVAPARVAAAARELEDAEVAIIERDDLDTQMRYAASSARRFCSPPERLVSARKRARAKGMPRAAIVQVSQTVSYS